VSPSQLGQIITSRKPQKESSRPESFRLEILPMTATTIRETTLRDYKERMLRVLVHIQQRLDDPLSLEKLAGLACLSPCHFHRVFTGMVGESVKGHIRRLRLERAAWRLKLEPTAIIQIALEAGYESHEAFTRAFRSNFSVPPTEYRRRKRLSGQLKATSGIHFNQQQRPARFRATQLRVNRMNQQMNVTIKQFEPLRVAFVRHTGPYHEVGKTWEKLCMFLGKAGLLGGDCKFVGLSHDDPEVTPPDKIRYDACVTVGKDFHPQGDIGLQVIGGGEYAVMTHFGPYEKLNESYTKLLGQWLPRSGRELRSGPSLEFYLNSPENTAPEKLLTEICTPLESK
jgi:AraC family transcriptional regulator